MGQAVRAVSFEGLALNYKKDSCLKMYSVCGREAKSYGKDQIRRVVGFVRSESSDFKCLDSARFGFVILDEDEELLQISMWGGESANHLYSTAYMVPRQGSPIHELAVEKDLNEDGAPLWNSLIMGWEAEAWSRFLSSSKSNGAKLVYLDTVFNENRGL